MNILAAQSYIMLKWIKYDPFIHCDNIETIGCRSYIKLTFIQWHSSECALVFP